MSKISSKVESISKLYIEPIPLGRSLSIVKFCQIDNTIALVDSEGTIFSNAVKKGYLYVAQHDPRIDRMVQCCAKMGLLSSEALKEFREDRQRKIDIDKYEWAVSNLKLYADELGLKLTAGQLATLEKSPFNTTAEENKDVCTKQES